MQKDIRICFIGDSLVNGTGDRQALGWTGRVCATANQSDFIVTHYNLGIRGNTSRDIALRWKSEFEQRKNTTADCRLVFSFGVNDTVLDNGHTRISETESLKNARTIIAQASEQARVIWIGPTPVDDAEQNDRIRNLSAHYQIISDELGVAYLPVLDTLCENPVWSEQVRVGDGSHPDSEGYTVLSDLILKWSGMWSFTAAD